ncbi:Cysteine proteinases superfamily protein [Perilla frutescens var. hirtella]|nr:Cysteine proteinases superfamily protein [Perilla frutescens var. hirtella]
MSLTFTSEFKRPYKSLRSTINIISLGNILNTQRISSVVSTTCFGVLCGRPRLWLLTSLSLSYAHGTAAAPFNRLLRTPPSVGGDRGDYVAHCLARSSGDAASLWHTILPSYWRKRQRTAVFCRYENEVDVRPAPWLHHLNFAWLIFGVSATALLVDPDPDLNLEVLVECDESKTNNYRVTGVTTDGRCLFRAIAHMACLRKGQKVPNEIQQKKLADELRAQVVEELLKRKKEVEWFIDEEFDVYVKRIEQPYIWGGEPELLMCSYVLRVPICVFMKDKKTGNLIKIADYGEEYRNEEENSINILFHRYSHYDILKAVSYFEV